MKIPKSFRLLGATFTVSFDDNLVEREGLLGRICYNKHEIVLQNPKARGVKDISKTSVEQTLFHEIIHAALGAAGREGLNEDEAFVDLLGQLLHQVMTTMKGEVKA